MGLHQYEIDFSQLSSDEKNRFLEHLENFTFNGLFWNENFQSAVFFTDEDLDISLLNVPDCCHLKRIL